MPRPLRYSSPPDQPRLISDLQAICMQKDWVSRLARRWKVSESTVRLWAKRGHLGMMHRTGINCVSIGSHAVYCFESKYADILGLGVPVISLRQILRRYAICRRTFYAWRKNSYFPAPLTMPGSKLMFWRVSDIEKWEMHWRITPQTTIVT